MEGYERVSLGGVGHVELSEGFFGLTPMCQMNEVRVNALEHMLHTTPMISSSLPLH